MKTTKFFALGIIFFSISSFRMPGAEVKGAQLVNGDDSNYVVIGAFSIQKNAINFTSSASKFNLDAHYELNKNRNLFYVYVLSTNDLKQAIDEALRLRKESPYFDTWVYRGALGAGGENEKGTDVNPESEQKIENVQQSDNSTVEKDTTVTAAVSEPAISEVKPEPEKSTPDAEIVGKSFFFKIFRSDDQVQVEGDVNVIDTERSRKIGTYTGNKVVGITDPKNKQGKISFVCEIFGFRKVQRDLDFVNPVGEDILVDENKTTVIPFQLVRLQKGDIAVMYNVFFFKDAAVMRPESRFEVTSLLTMLQENEKYKIKIHGHTNGGAHGRIISLNEGNDNYFALNDTKDGVGSAKELSEQRAEVVKEFLVSNGIDPNRMEIKAWGGKRPLYDKHSPQAQSNVRVEIEILEN